jgi:hypothetical protein
MHRNRFEDRSSTNQRKSRHHAKSLVDEIRRQLTAEHDAQRQIELLELGFDILRRQQPIRSMRKAWR